MDTTTIAHSQINHPTDETQKPTAQIWFGPEDIVLSEIVVWLQKTIVHNHSQTQCVTCNSLRMREHHSLYWINPEKNYILEDLEPIFQVCSFKRDALDPFFIVFQKAESLSAQCANSLLKLVEEPPTGYHFIFLTNKLESILPTIRSRCHIHTFSAIADTPYPSALIDLLLDKKSNALTFAKELDAGKFDETESMKMLNDLVVITTQKTRSALVNDDTASYTHWTNLHSLILESIAQPPMAGSSKLFWRNMYLKTRLK